MSPKFLNQILPRTVLLVALVFAGMVTLGGLAAKAQDATQPQAPASSQDAAQSGQRSDGQVEMDVVHALDASRALKNDMITAATIQGQVTLSGTVSSDASRELAESIVAHVSGVAGVTNNLKVGNPQAAADGQPAPDQQVAANDPDDSMAPVPPNADGPGNVPGQAPYPGQAQAPAGNYPNQGQYPNQGHYPNQGQPPYPNQGQPYPNQGQYPNQSQPPYPNQGQPYPNQGQYPNQPPPYPNQQSPYPNQAQGQPYPGQPYPDGRQQYAPAPHYTQPSGPVVIPQGTLLQLRTSEALDSKRAKDGAGVQFTVIRDVAVGGVLAIPRGATIHGVVTEVKKAGDLGGSAELALRLTALDLGGHSYDLDSDQFKVKGPNKAGQTAGNTLGGALIGAIIGGAVGRGGGAAIGAGAGAAAGLGASAASGGPRAWIPAEALVTFHLNTPLTVEPVDAQEAARLAEGLYQGGPNLYRRGPYSDQPYMAVATPHTAIPRSTTARTIQSAAFTTGAKRLVAPVPRPAVLRVSRPSVSSSHRGRPKLSGARFVFPSPQPPVGIRNNSRRTPTFPAYS